MAQRKRTTLGIKFGRILKSLRESRGWTQEELAAAIDYSRVQIAYIEGGFRQPSLGAILLLEDALELPAGELVRLVSNERKASK